MPDMTRSPICGHAVQIYWRFCRVCGTRIAWQHEATATAGICSCGQIFCKYLIARLSARLANQLKLTQEEGANLQ